jgi:outer membrane protein assembly factor BamB
MRREARRLGLILAIGLLASGAGAEPPFLALLDTDAAPPYTNGAVGPDHLMVMLKTQVKIQNRDGTDSAFPVLGLSAFWTPVTAGASVSGPRVVYDPVDYGDPRNAALGRWVVASYDNGAPTARLLVGVSKTEVPRLDVPASMWNHWHMASIPVGPSTSVRLEAPTIGFSADKVLVQVNLVAPGTGAFLQSNLYVFDKAAMYGGNLTPSAGRTITPDANALTVDHSPVPAVTYDGGVTDLYLLQTWEPGAGKLRVYRLAGDAASAMPVTAGEVQGPVAWSDGFGIANVLPQKQVGCSCPAPPCQVQAGDSRIQNVVLRGGSLWATQTVFFTSPTSRAAAQWWQIKLADLSVTQHGLVDNPSGPWQFAYPSLAVNKYGDVLLGYSRFNPGEYVQAGWSFHLASDAPGFMRPTFGFKGGEACYYKDIFSTPSQNYWGRYSTTVVDPDDVRMWTLQEYAASPDTSDHWGTYWDVSTPKVSVADALAVSEDAAGTTPSEFLVSLSVPSSVEVKVLWTTEDDSATALGGDYESASGTLVFAPGTTTQTIQVSVKDDITHEPVPESFRVRLSSPENAILLDDLAAGPISDDDPPPQIAINDVQVVEGTAAGETKARFLVTLSNPSAVDVKVWFRTTPGTATSPADFTALPDTELVFDHVAGEVSKLVEVTVTRDAVEELPDRESFYVDLLGTPSPVGGQIQKSRGTAVVVDDDASYPPVVGLTATSDDGRNRLQWVNPPWSGAAPTVHVRFDTGDGCGYPSSTGDGQGFTVAFGAGGEKRMVSHPDPSDPLVNGVRHCYAVFLDYGGGHVSAAATVTGTPFATGNVKWKYTIGQGPGLPVLTAPNVGLYSVLVPANDRRVHGMSRGPTGGTWPADWTPSDLGSVAHARSGIVPIAGEWWMYLSTEDGWVHAIDSRTGAFVWQTQIGTQAGAAPAGIFTRYGAPHSYVLVGTRHSAGSNYFYALDPETGAVIDRYQVDGLVTSMASVDYDRRQVYFATDGATQHSLWCLKIGPPSDALQHGWEHQRADDYPLAGVHGVGDIDSSPILRRDRTVLYVGNKAGVVFAIDPADGSIARTQDNSTERRVTTTPAVKGSPFQDSRSRDVYVVTTAATDNVWKLEDDTVLGFHEKWRHTAPNPSVPLLSTQLDRLYVSTDDVDLADNGQGAGVLELRLDHSEVRKRSLESVPGVLGAPSLDTQATPSMLLHVGSISGVFYAVEVPF